MQHHKDSASSKKDVKPVSTIHNDVPKGNMELEDGLFWVIQDSSIGFILTNTFEGAESICKEFGLSEICIEEFSAEILNDFGAHNIERECGKFLESITSDVTLTLREEE